jgi:hypothetical protein
MQWLPVGPAGLPMTLVGLLSNRSPVVLPDVMSWATNNMIVP